MASNIAIGTNSGFVSVRPTDAITGGIENTFDDRAYATKDTSPAGTNAVSEVGFAVRNDTADATCEVGIYSHDAANNRPNALLATAASLSKGTVKGWKYAAYSLSIDESTTYWIAAQVDDTVTTTQTERSDTITGARKGHKLAQTALPSSWGAFDAVIDNQAMPFYALYVAAASGSLPLRSPRKNIMRSLLAR